MDLASHTLSLSSDGKLKFVPLDPSMIKTKSEPKPMPSVEEDIVSPASATTAESMPTSLMDTESGLSASAGANSPSASASLSVGAVGGAAGISVSSPGATASSPDNPMEAEPEMRSKRKGRSMPGFGKKHKSVSGGGDVSTRKSREAKVQSMPGFAKGASESSGKRIPLC